MRQVLTILLTSLLLSSCSLYRSVRVQNKIQEVELTNAPVNDTIQPRYAMGLYVVDVYINDHPEPLEFIFDTGANLTVVSKEAADRLGLEPSGKLNLGDSQGQRRTTSLVEIDQLRLGKGVYEDVLGVIIEYPENSSIRCLAKDGILGYHVIRKMQWAIVPKDTLLIGSTTDITSQFNNLTAVPMRGWKAPHLDLTHKGISYPSVMFDSGSTGGLDLEYHYAKTLSDSIPMVAYADGTTQGVYGNKLDTLYRLYDQQLTLGELTLTSNMEFDPKESGKIGMATLGHYVLVLDGLNETLYIGEDQFPAEPAVNYGMVPGLQDSTLYVASMELDGQAAQKGLVLNQKIVAINGHTADYLSVMDCGYFYLVHVLLGTDEIELELTDGSKVTLQRSPSTGGRIHGL